MQLGRKAYLSAPHGVSGVQATSAFHLRGLHRQAPFDPQFEDLDEKNLPESDPNDILQYFLFGDPKLV